jgi:uncharacterized membrane protein YjjB (DUF3815 family)
MNLLKKDTMQELKIWLFNAIAISLSFTDVSNALKISILTISLAYSIIKLWDLILRRRHNAKDRNSEEDSE